MSCSDSASSVPGIVTNTFYDASKSVAREDRMYVSIIFDLARADYVRESGADQRRSLLSSLRSASVQ